MAPINGNGADRRAAVTAAAGTAAAADSAPVTDRGEVNRGRRTPAVVAAATDNPPLEAGGESGHPPAAAGRVATGKSSAEGYAAAAAVAVVAAADEAPAAVVPPVACHAFPPASGAPADGARDSDAPSGRGSAAPVRGAPPPPDTVADGRSGEVPALDGRGGGCGGSSRAGIRGGGVGVAPPVAVPFAGVTGVPKEARRERGVPRPAPAVEPARQPSRPRLGDALATPDDVGAAPTPSPPPPLPRTPSPPLLPAPPPPPPPTPVVHSGDTPDSLSGGSGEGVVSSTPPRAIGSQELSRHGSEPPAGGPSRDVVPSPPALFPRGAVAAAPSMAADER